MVLGGLSALQRRANSLALIPAQSAVYVEVFQSGNQVGRLPPSWQQHGCTCF